MNNKIKIVKIVVEVPEERPIAEALGETIALAFKDSVIIELWHKGAGPLVVNPFHIMATIQESTKIKETKDE